jgi:hypothetical protein
VASKSFEAIPGPPGNGLPILGHMLELFAKPAGFEKSWKNLKIMQSKYLTKEDKIMRLHAPMMNPKNGKVLVLFDVDDVEHVYRHEGKYPTR